MNWSAGLRPGSLAANIGPLAGAETGTLSAWCMVAVSGSPWTNREARRVSQKSRAISGILPLPASGNERATSHKFCGHKSLQS